MFRCKHAPLFACGAVAEHRVWAAVEQRRGQQRRADQRSRGGGIDAVEYPLPYPRATAALQCSVGHERSG